MELLLKCKRIILMKFLQAIVMFSRLLSNKHLLGDNYLLPVTFFFLLSFMKCFLSFTVSKQELLEC